MPTRRQRRGGNAGRGSDFALRRQRHSRRKGQRIAEMTAAKAEQLIEQALLLTA